jgi:DNA processing protein
VRDDRRVPPGRSRGTRAEARRSRSAGLAWPPGFARRPADRDAALVLSALRGISPGRLLELAQSHRTAGVVLRRIRDGHAGSASDRTVAGELRADLVAASLATCGARFVCAGEPEYPPQLEHLADPPLAIFVRGRSLGPASQAVSIVGARNCSDQGRDVSYALARTLSFHGITVVSGGARGVDAAAHEGALAAGGLTTAVLGCGIDADRSRRTRMLLDRILERGTVVSEYPPGVPPDAFRFPARNRIVAALSRALVVVEGEADSGSLISAEHALDIGRDVFAVPSSITSPLSAAPHRLIREGATLIRGAQDLLVDLDLANPEQPRLAGIDLSPREREALGAVLGSDVPDRIAARLGVSVPEALGVLLRLEMRGLVRSVGGRFERRS